MYRTTIYSGPGHAWGPWWEYEHGWGPPKTLEFEFSTIARRHLQERWKFITGISQHIKQFMLSIRGKWPSRQELVYVP